MHKYVFILGRKRHLSSTEIKAVFQNAGYKMIADTLIVEMEKPLKDPQRALDNLGGTIKIGEIIHECSDLKTTESTIIKYLNEKRDGKIIFALSFYNMTQGFQKILKNLLKNVKKGLRRLAEGKVRFLNKPDNNIKSVAVHEEKLAEKGTDISIINQDGRFLIAHTIAVQNFRKYSIRDYDRPCRDAKSGMLPPKLAQMMINLACGDAKEATIYDLFCGSGTVLMEGALMGHKVIGSDISEKAISDSQKNLKWLTEKFDVDSSLILDIFVKDATKLISADLEITPNYIVCETYLGPPMSRFPSENEMRKNFGEIEDIVLGAFRQLKSIIDKGSIIVMAIPFYRQGSKRYFLNNLKRKANELGYEVIGDTLLYDRKDQIVGREICRFKLS